ncbi:MAG: ATP-binding protein [Planctomycetaceae bacterium]
MLSRRQRVNAGDHQGAQWTDCEREAIHIPGSIQPHGCLVVLSSEHRIVQVSENLEDLLGIRPDAAIGSRAVEVWNRVFGAEQTAGLQFALERRLPDHGSDDSAAKRPVLLATLNAVSSSDEARRFHAVAHRTGKAVVIEFERVEDEPHETSAFDLHSLIDAYTAQIEEVKSIAEMCQVTCETVRRLTGFDRALIYRFDENWHGTVIGEDGSGRLPSYLHHRFPASDIPAQARELYRSNRLRIIPDARYRPIPLTPPVNPVTSSPLDMSFSTLRSVSPVHVEYMRNMETAASMSVSILREGRLWGLISLHHQDARSVPFPLRSVCDLIGRAFSLRLSALEHADDFAHRSGVRSCYAKLLDVMSNRPDFAAALAENPQALMGIANAQGAAIVTQDGLWLLGQTPSEPEVRELTQWLFTSVKQDVFATDRLSKVWSVSDQCKERASGLLAIAVSKLHASYVLWFRPEVPQTIQWGGDPTAAPAQRESRESRLHPRRSFATWLETVKDLALPWNASEVDGVTELRNIIVGTVLRRAEELAALNAELIHSNKELESFSYSVSHDLRAPLRHIVGYAEILREDSAGSLTPRARRCVDTIIESSEYAGRLVDKLLDYSRLGRSELQRSQVDMNELFRELQADVMRDADDREVAWHIADLPTVSADLMMLRMVVRDLLSNAIKYTRGRQPAVIEVGCESGDGDYTFWVKDNGVGFSMEYVDKLFGVFQRLHRWEDYEGTGIGLANVRRVIERHAGRTWAVGEEGKGATFFFTLPEAGS